MLTSGSLIQSTFGSPESPGNFEVVLYRPLPPGSGEARHYWRENIRQDKLWQASAVITSSATGPASIIQTSDGFLHAVVLLGTSLGHFRMSPQTKRWEPVATFAYGATGPGALCEYRSSGNLEVVALHGSRLVHHWYDGGGWHMGATITDRAIGPAALIQNRNNNLEVLALEGSRLVLYWRDEQDQQHTWRPGGVVSQQATGPAGFVQGTFGPSDNPNFEVVVPEGDRLRHYWRDHSQSGWPWVAGAVVTWGRGPIRAASLASTVVEGNNLDALVQEGDDNVFHYYRIDTGRWFRGTCLRLNEGPVINSGTSDRLKQLTGQFDFPTRDPLPDAPWHCIQGTDLGASFQHGGRTYFLFGDTHWSDQRRDKTRDVMAVLQDGNAANSLALKFQRSCMNVRGGCVTMAEYDVPLDGFSHKGEMYVFFTSDHCHERRVMYRSVLTRCATQDPGREIIDSYQLPLLFIPPDINFDYIGDLSADSFVNVSVAIVEAEEIRRWNLPASSRGLLLWGSGAYRADTMTLACLPLDGQAPNLDDIRFFRGAKYGQPQWSDPGRQHEAESVPLFYPAALGELSVRWNAILRRWVLLYCSGPEDAAGVTLRLSRTPWGPWSPRRVVLDWLKDAMERYIHRADAHDGLNQDDTPFPRTISAGGAAYAPYQLAEHTTEQGSEVMIDYALSTWNPYQTVLMRHVITRADLRQIDGLYSAIWEAREAEGRQVRHNMTSAEYQRAFEEFARQGFRLTYVSGYEAGNDVLYAAIWEQRDGPDWQAHHGLTSQEFQQTFDELAQQRFRLTRISGYAVRNQAHFAAIWERRDGPPWQARHGMTDWEYQKAFDDFVRQGYRLVRISGYEVDNEVRYAAIWEKRDGPEWHARHGLTATQYQDIFNELVARGFRLTDISSYHAGYETLYAGIWERRDGPAWQARHGLSEAEFLRACAELASQGFWPTCVSG